MGVNLTVDPKSACPKKSLAFPVKMPSLQLKLLKDCPFCSNFSTNFCLLGDVLEDTFKTDIHSPSTKSEENPLPCACNSPTTAASLSGVM